MTSKGRGLILLGATLLCAVAFLPARISDDRPTFASVVKGTQAKLDQAAATVKRIIVGPQAATPEPAIATPSQVGPVLAAPQAVQDGSALKEAYAVAEANARLRALGYDPAGIMDAIAAYRAQDLAAGDTLMAKIGNPVARAALEWMAIYEAPQKVAFGRLESFMTAHADWPVKNWVRHQEEAHLFRVLDPKVVERFFATSAPATAIGKFVLARALKNDGHVAEGIALARSIFRENDLAGFLDAKLKSDFGADITKDDYKYRADRLLYKEQIGPALHYAALAGPDVVALEKARAAVIADAPSDKAIAEVPVALRKDPGLILSEVQKLRRSDRLMEAARLMQTAPRDPAQLIEADDWWTERRVLARRLLDAGNTNAAYVMCASSPASSGEAHLEAEFHAGWIALRFMNDPARGAYHFGQAAKIAETPTSVARIAYWRARTAEASGATDAVAKATAFYRMAAEHGSTYYGQLARLMLGTTSDLVKVPSAEATGPDRDVVIRVIALLYAAGQHDVATALGVDAANTLTDSRQVAALARVIEEQGDAHLALTIGKLVGLRGIAVDTLAFPTFGIPHYDRLQNSADPAVVYSIARQESAFMPSVVSKAGAKGLMQMIDATAKRTAMKAGLPFDGARMVTDAAFNAQLGAAHLGELLAEQNGSYILTFAAYNAGGVRVKQWIEAYGDPRDPGVDPVDWVERIPFSETRNYVQRVTANLGMYRAIFADAAKKAAAQPDRQAKL